MIFRRLRVCVKGASPRAGRGSRCAPALDPVSQPPVSPLSENNTLFQSITKCCTSFWKPPPCFNESATIQAVINDFRAQLPHAVVYVCDNNSRDDTAALAKAAGAVVWHEPLQGKGNVIRRMFADIDSDLYVIVDGDSTYPASHIGALIACLLENRLDMAVGRRIPKKDAHRAYHSFGNHLFNYFTGRLFGRPLMDMFSGYRVFSRRFVKSFPALSRGFEIEAEMCVHALELKLPFMEIDVPYTSRPTGSFSKLHTVRDGLKILLKILNLYALNS